MDSSLDSRWKTSLVQDGFPDRAFDVEFWHEQGEKLFSPLRGRWWF